MYMIMNLKGKFTVQKMNDNNKSELILSIDKLITAHKLKDNLYRVFKENNVNLLTASDAHRLEDVGRYLARLKV